MFKTQAFFIRKKYLLKSFVFFSISKTWNFCFRPPIDSKSFFIDRVWVSSYGENCLEVPKTLHEFVIEKITFFVTVFLVRLCAPTSRARPFGWPFVSDILNTLTLEQNWTCVPPAPPRLRSRNMILSPFSTTYRKSLKLKWNWWVEGLWGLNTLQRGVPNSFYKLSKIGIK